MSDEIWKPIKKSRGQYEASSFGRIRNKRTGRILVIKEARSRSPMLTLYGFMGGRSYTVGQLVAMAFFPDEKDYRVFHKNKNLNDSRPENLRLIPREKKDAKR